MAVICSNSYGWVLDHKAFIDRQYCDTDVKMKEHVSEAQKSQQESLAEACTRTVKYEQKQDLFALYRPFLMDSQVQAINLRAKEDVKRKKRKRTIELNVGEKQALDCHNLVKDKIMEGYLSLKSLSEQTGVFKQLDKSYHGNNEEARSAAMISGPGDGLRDLCEMAKILEPGQRKEIQSDTHMSLPSDVVSRLLCYRGEVASAVCLLGERYILPPRCSFLLSDISQLDLLANDCKNHYNLIVVDPPWENKSVKRQKTYSRMCSDDLLHIPVPILATSGCIVVVWVTNRERHQTFVKDELFPAWNVKWLAKWHWLKVTTSGEMVYDFESAHKKPYEALMIGQFNREDEAEQKILSIPEWQLLISVPCSIHSKKIPVTDVLKRYLPDRPQCLELFARNLTEGWDSWGNEVLKHQHIDYYDATDT